MSVRCAASLWPGPQTVTTRHGVTTLLSASGKQKQLTTTNTAVIMHCQSSPVPRRQGGIPAQRNKISAFIAIGIEANTRGVPRVHVSVCRLTPTCTRYLLDKCFFWQTGAVNISVRKRRAERSRGRYPSLESRFPRGVAAAPAGGQVARRSTGVNANPRRYKRSINPPARVVMRGEIEGARDGENRQKGKKATPLTSEKVSAASCSSQLGSDGEVHTATKENSSPQP
ncbi:hypothetical protein Bbelb_424580 [Branchiostoma belcheri]|nr:hypothetical protein Bbelb_424580 [Branchiostoma belcheri]